MQKYFTDQNIKKVISLVLIFLILGVLQRSCTTLSEIRKINKRMDTLTIYMNTINSKVKTDEEYRKMLNENMFNFLQYEEDIDNKKVTFSELKLLLQKNK